MADKDLDKLIAQAETRELKDQRFWPQPPTEAPNNTTGSCRTPQRLIYVVFANCLVINNGACPDWDLCDSLLGDD